MSTVCVTLCDEPYFHKAIQTIRDIRTVGQWTGDLVLITVGFTLSEELSKKYSIQTVSFPLIPTEKLRAHYQSNPLSTPTCDGREYKKCTQWEKLHVFDVYFKQWERVLFVDAGLRILDGIDFFLSLEWKGRFLAPDDTWNDENKRFRCQVETINTPHILESLVSIYGDLLDQKYFLNCMFLFDTSLLSNTSKEEMISIMDTYPLWRTNEMGVMNVFFTFHLKVWTPFPSYAKNGKYLFDWCEYNRINTKWYEYCALKYPATLPHGKTIGVAIPCYNKHIPKLLELLDSIDAQTRKPDLVSISCSSTDEFPLLKKYGFGVVVSICKERRNAGQNRNIAARRLTTDIISFFDADDHMHPQRIEGLLVAFNEPCDIALHSYLEGEETKVPYSHIDTFTIIRNKLVQAPSGCIYLDPYSRIHHSQVTVRREIFEQSPFSGEKENDLKDDCVFCYKIFSMPGINSAYLPYFLSKYIPTFSCFDYVDGKI